MTVDAPTRQWAIHGMRLLKSLTWAATCALFGWLLGLQPTWQLLILALACLLFDLMEAKNADWRARWVERLIRLLVWGMVFAALCWLLSLQPTWQLLVFAAACTLVDVVLDRWLPAPPILNLR